MASIPGGVDCAALVVGAALLVDTFASVAKAGVGGAVLFSRAMSRFVRRAHTWSSDRRYRGGCWDSDMRANCMGFAIWSIACRSSACRSDDGHPLHTGRTFGKLLVRQSSMDELRTSASGTIFGAGSRSMTMAWHNGQFIR